MYVCVKFAIFVRVVFIQMRTVCAIFLAKFEIRQNHAACKYSVDKHAIFSTSFCAFASSNVNIGICLEVLQQKLLPRNYYRFRGKLSRECLQIQRKSSWSQRRLRMFLLKFLFVVIILSHNSIKKIQRIGQTSFVILKLFLYKFLRY